MHSSIAEALDAAARSGLRVDAEPMAMGGSSLIFLARDEMGRRAVLKVALFGSRSRDEDWLLRRAIRKEAAVLTRLDSPHLPALFSVDSDGRYLCRAYLPGLSLDVAAARASSDRQKRDRLTSLLRMATSIFPLFHQAPEGAFAIRDLKPRNIVLSPRGGMVLVDVGSVRRERDMRTGRRRVPRIGTGKWCHWPPEQLRERGPELDRRVDYFALGSTASFLLSGRFPYENRHSDPETLMRVYLAEFDRVARELERYTAAVGASPEVRQFLIACLHPDARSRPTVPLPVRAEEALVCEV